MLLHQLLYFCPGLRRGTASGAYQMVEYLFVIGFLHAFLIGDGIVVDRIVYRFNHISTWTIRYMIPCLFTIRRSICYRQIHPAPLAESVSSSLHLLIPGFLCHRLIYGFMMYGLIDLIPGMLMCRCCGSSLRGALFYFLRGTLRSPLSILLRCPCRSGLLRGALRCPCRSGLLRGAFCHL